MCNKTRQNSIRVGDSVIYSTWGGNDTAAKIERIEFCHSMNDKYGDEVQEVSSTCLHRCTFDLDNGHWCYGYQIKDVI